MQPGACRECHGVCSLASQSGIAAHGRVTGSVHAVRKRSTCGPIFRPVTRRHHGEPRFSGATVLEAGVCSPRPRLCSERTAQPPPTAAAATAAAVRVPADLPGSVRLPFDASPPAEPA